MKNMHFRHKLILDEAKLEHFYVGLSDINIKEYIRNGLVF
jgi:hypothetical protein